MIIALSGSFNLNFSGPINSSTQSDNNSSLKASDTRSPQPGINGVAPYTYPNGYNGDWTWDIDYAPPIAGGSTTNEGIFVARGDASGGSAFSNSPGISLDGPPQTLTEFGNPPYIKSYNLNIEQVETYVPVIYLGSASWYNHEFTFDMTTSTSTSLSFDMNLGITGDSASAKIIGGQTITTENKQNLSWDYSADNGGWTVINLKMDFMHVYGNVTYFDDSTRHYNVISLYYVDWFAAYPTYSNLGDDLVRPDIVGNVHYILDGNNNPDHFPSLPGDFSYSLTSILSITNSFGIWLDLSNGPISLSGSVSFSHTATSIFSTSQKFVDNLPYNELGSGIDYFLVEIDNFYNVNLDPHYESSSGGGGSSGCPILSVFDNTQYISEGLLNIHDLQGTEITTYHTLTTTPTKVNDTYLLRLTEYPCTISNIDCVKLYGILPNGNEVPLRLKSAIHSYFGDVTKILYLNDGNCVDEYGGVFMPNGISQSIDLTFFDPTNIHWAGFVFEIQGVNMLIK